MPQHPSHRPLMAYPTPSRSGVQTQPHEALQRDCAGPEVCTVSGRWVCPAPMRPEDARCAYSEGYAHIYADVSQPATPSAGARKSLFSPEPEPERHGLAGTGLTSSIGILAKCFGFHVFRIYVEGVPGEDWLLTVHLAEIGTMATKTVTVPIPAEEPLVPRIVDGPVLHAIDQALRPGT